MLNMARPKSGPVTASIPEVVWEGLRDGRLGLLGPMGSGCLYEGSPVDHRALNRGTHPEGTAGVQFWAEQVPRGWQKYELVPS